MDVILILVVLLGILIGSTKLSQSMVTKMAATEEAAVNDLKPDSKSEGTNLSAIKPSVLRLLPMAFYVIACLGFVAFLILAVQAESGYLFGYGIGATIACLGSGRVIELLQIIADELQQKRLSESP